MSKAVVINESTPTLAKWVEETEMKDDNRISGYINTMRDLITDLVYVADNLKPWPSEPASKDYDTVDQAARLMANLLFDLKAIRAEVNQARA